MNDQQKIYVLLLDNNKYYIGKTNNVVAMLSKLLNDDDLTYGDKIIDLVRVNILTDINEEDLTVLEYMRKYGIENVRGGSYTNQILSDDEVTTIKNKIAIKYNLCFDCLQAGHSSNKCVFKTDPFDDLFS